MSANWHDLGPHDPIPADEQDRVASRCKVTSGAPVVPERQGVPAHPLWCSRAAGHTGPHRTTQAGGYWEWAA